MRIEQDGHPEPYQLRYIELGNEQYNTYYVEQVKAMEARATKIGKPKFFYYMSPNNAHWLNASQAAEVEALGLGDHVVSDMHVGAGGGVQTAETLFAKFPGKVSAPARTHTHSCRPARTAADHSCHATGAGAAAAAGAVDVSSTVSVVSVPIISLFEYN